MTNREIFMAIADTCLEVKAYCDDCKCEYGNFFMRKKVYMRDLLSKVEKVKGIETLLYHYAVMITELIDCLTFEEVDGVEVKFMNKTVVPHLNTLKEWIWMYYDYQARNDVDLPFMTEYVKDNVVVEEYERRYLDGL